MPDALPVPARYYQFDDLHIDVMRQQVTRQGGEALDVSGLSFRLLHYLLTQGTRVVGFDELIAGIWSPAHVNEETVTQRVRLLRQALGDDGRQPRYLRSVRGQGYQLCSEPSASIARPPALAPARSWPRPVVAGGIALLVAVVVVGWQWSRSPTAAPPALLQRADYYAGIGQRDNNERALALYRQRLQEAPDDTGAMLGIARAQAARLCLYGGSENDVDQAQAMAEAVLERQPRSAAAHAARAYALDCRGDVGAALASYERSVQLDPDADASRASAAYLYGRQGRLADALAANLAVRHPERVRFLALQVASNLDLLGYAAAAEARYRRSFQLYPDNVFSNIAWPAFLYRHGRTDEARAALREAQARGTAHADLHLLGAELALLQADPHAARQEAGKARALKPHASLPATVAWVTGGEARPAASALMEKSKQLRDGMAHGSDAIDGLDAALLADLAGDRPGALAALQAAVAAGYRDAGYLRVSPLFAGLREDPGFPPVLAAIEAAIAAEREKAAGWLPADAGDLTAVR